MSDILSQKYINMGLIYNHYKDMGLQHMNIGQVYTGTHTS